MGLQLGLYRHFKGTIYDVVGVATDSETGFDMAIYYDSDHPVDSVEDPKLWVRPVSMFFETVKNKDGVEVLRFEPYTEDFD